MAEPEWNRERLQQMIDEKIEEHSQLDYKAAASLDRNDKAKAEITKDVSAFANSNGGTIIYGVREFSEPDKKHFPEKIDPVDGRSFSKELAGSDNRSDSTPHFRHQDSTRQSWPERRGDVLRR